MKEIKIKECQTINDWGKGKPVTLIYKATIDSTELEKPLSLKVSPESEKLYDKLKNQLPKLTVTVKVEDSQSGPSYNASSASGSDKVVLLELQRVGSLEVTISVEGKPIDTAHIVIPSTHSYKLPIPKAALLCRA